MLLPTTDIRTITPHCSTPYSPCIQASGIRPTLRLYWTVITDGYGVLGNRRERVYAIPIVCNSSTVRHFLRAQCISAGHKRYSLVIRSSRAIQYQNIVSPVLKSAGQCNQARRVHIASNKRNQPQPFIVREQDSGKDCAAQSKRRAKK